MPVQFLILGRGELGAVLILTLLTEQGQLEMRKPIIQLTQLFESLVARCIERLIALGRGDSRFPD